MATQKDKSNEQLNDNAIKCLRVIDQHGQAAAIGMTQYLDIDAHAIDDMVAGLESLGFIFESCVGNRKYGAIWRLTDGGREQLSLTATKH